MGHAPKLDDRGRGGEVLRFHRLSSRLFLRNVPLLLGLAILFLLLIVALVGPRMATENPYLSGMRSTELVDGQLITPPFPPSAQYPLGSDRWGRDLLSLLLYGVRNTLVACLFVTMIRLVLGVVLGGWVGWRAGGLADRVVMGIVEVLSSLPLMIVGMLLIYALDIRRGLVVFLVALSLVGWGEIAQYVRTEFMTLREQPFVEGAYAVGLTAPQIIVRHLLPNILPQLVVLTLLEMGAVLMLLGELGFVGVFIGGGSQTEMLSGNAVIADVPEWGAILAGARGFIRSAPSVLLYPSLAFAFAVLGFNSLGEGLRRVIREAGVNTAALMSKWVALVGLGVALLTWIVVRQISPSVSYVALADRFDSEQAIAQAEAISSPQSADPGFGTAGALAAAEYIASELERYGALPAAEIDNYLQPVVRQVAAPLRVSQVALLDEAGDIVLSLEYGIDFGEQTYRHGGSGSVSGQLLYLGFARRDLSFGDYRGLELEGRVVVCVRDDAPAVFDNEALIRGAEAVLYVTNDVTPHCDLGTQPGAYMQAPSLPIIHISPEAWQELLLAQGIEPQDLDRVSGDALVARPDSPWVGIPLPQPLLVDVALGPVEERSGYNVLAILPGSDIGMDDQAIMLAAAYDYPEQASGQSFSTTAGGSAAGLLLGTVRLWQQEDFKPRRTVLLSFWAGEPLYESGAETYEREYSPYKSLQRQAAIQVGSVGSGTGDLAIAGGNESLRRLVRRSAATVGTGTVDGEHMALPNQHRGTVWIYQPDALTVYASRDGAQSLDADRIYDAGRLINVVMITASRQYYYD